MYVPTCYVSNIRRYLLNSSITVCCFKHERLVPIVVLLERFLDDLE